MKNNKITIIGLGEIGSEILKEINKKQKDVFGVDINSEILKKLSNEGYKVGKEIPLSNIYIIAVYLTKQVLDIIKKIDCSNNPLIIIESTIIPGVYKEIIEWKKQNNYKFDIIIFPHRFNPNDLEHHVFNLSRVMGGEEKAVKRALNFYKEFIPLNLIHITTPEIAELSKPMENAYRFVEIAIAEEMKMLCDEKNLDFNDLRKAMNTKWNINVKEARDGIDGKCLPKDMKMINNFLKDNSIFKNAMKIDEKFRRYVKNKNE